MLEYTVQKPEEDEPRHFLSAVSLGNNGRQELCLKTPHVTSMLLLAEDHVPLCQHRVLTDHMYCS